MSAFIVNIRHIDAILTAALELPPYQRPFRWLAAGDPEDTDYQPGEPWGPTAVANLTARSRTATLENASNIGRMLLFENMRSFAHRYNCKLDIPVYDYHHGPKLTPVEVLKALACYEYQTCEHPGWKGSDAYSFCSTLRHTIIGLLPGYEDAQWEVTDTPARTAP